MLYEFEGDKTLLLTFYTVLFLIGITLIFFAVKQLREISHFLSTGKATTAIVDEILTIKDSEGDSSFKPVFAFEDENGKAIRFEHNTSSNPLVWKKGEEISIVYDPENSENAHVIAYWTLYGWPVFLLIFAFPLITISLGYFCFLYYLKCL